MGNTLDPHSNEIRLTAPAGSAVILNAHTRHGGTLNVSSEQRLRTHLASVYAESQSNWYNRMPSAHRYLLDIKLPKL